MTLSPPRLGVFKPGRNPFLPDDEEAQAFDRLGRRTQQQNLRQYQLCERLHAVRNLGRMSEDIRRRIIKEVVVGNILESF